jgi:hypothetical protein
MTTPKPGLDIKLRVRFYATAEVTVIEHIKGERRSVSKTEFFDIKIDEVPPHAFRDGKIPDHAIYMAEQKIIDLIDLKYYPDGILKKWDLFADLQCTKRVSTYKRTN